MHCFRRAVSRLQLSPATPVSSITPGTLSRSKCIPSTSMFAAARFANATQMRWNSQGVPIRYTKPRTFDERGTPAARQPRSNYMREDPSPKTTVYVGNLFFDVTAEDLRQQFEQFGVVENAVIVHDSRGLSKGFGYVTYSTTEEAGKAIMEADASVIEGREVTVQYANTVYRAKSEETPSTCLYIGNIPYELTDLDLQALFEDIQGVDDIRIPVDRRTGLPRGFAHIDFHDQRSATDGKEKLSRRAPYGRKLRVNYARRKIMNPESHERHQMKKMEKMEREKNKRLAAAQPAGEDVDKMDFDHDGQVVWKE